MGATAVYEIPYPEGSDSPNGPSQMQAIAEAVEAALIELAQAQQAHEDKVAAGVESVSFTSQTSFLLDTLYGKTFDTVPSVVCTINGGAAVTGFYHVRALNRTETEFDLWVFRQSGLSAQTWSDVPVSWHAMEESV